MCMSKKNEQKVEQVVINDVDQVLETLPTKSAKIRYLLSNNMTRGQVAKKLNIRYQHVRNVEITPIKKQKV